MRARASCIWQRLRCEHLMVAILRLPLAPVNVKKNSRESVEELKR
jgi:hypothetical protein